MSWERYLPILGWGRRYHRATLGRDLVAAVIVTLMLIPQSLAYALLAGLPPVVGLYASITPLLIYALFGTSTSLSMGPVAVIALMTGATLGSVAAPGSVDYLTAALLLSMLVGALLLLMGLLRLGFLANFLSHPVISGFVTASALIIAASQLGPLLGIESSGHDLWRQLLSLAEGLGGINGPTLALGGGALAFLLLARRYLEPLLVRLGMGARWAQLVTRSAPILAVAAGITATWMLDLAALGVAVVGAIPSGLPPLTLPPLDAGRAQALLMGALLIALVGFVESVSVGQTLAARRRQRIDPDQELIGLGGANLGAAFTGGMPVTASFSRSVVNFDAGAATPAAGAFTALGIALASLLLTPLIAWLPLAILAATIIVSVLSLVDFGAIGRTFRYSRGDGAAMLATILVTLGQGVEEGILAGVGLSLALHLYRTSRPHSALVGRVPGSEHFRNERRHSVETDSRLAILRIDESLYFANARYLEETLLELVAERPRVSDLVLTCQAVNSIDASALESLEAIQDRLGDAGVRLHLAEVKGPVMDRLAETDFVRNLSGRIFLSTYEAWCSLHGDGPAGRSSPPPQKAASR